MALPDLKDVRILAIEDQVIEERGTETRKANPFPMDVVKGRELIVDRYASTTKTTLVIYSWFVLCMTYASLRFDDALHVKPSSLKMVKGVLYGKCWQTKVERRRRGTFFAVPAVSLAGVDWLQKGFEVYKSVTTKEGWEADFWIPAAITWEEMSSSPVDYQRFVAQMRRCLTQITKLPGFADYEFNPDDYSGHTPRVTMINASSHAEESQLAQMVQANWKSAEMPLAYTRENKQIAIKMISSVVKKIKKGWRPSEDREKIDHDSSDEDGVPETVFYVRNNRSRRLQYHMACRINTNRLACKDIKLTTCEPIADVSPDLTMICTDCLDARPDWADL